MKKIIFALFSIFCDSSFAKEATIPFIIKQQTIRSFDSMKADNLPIMKDHKTGEPVVVMQTDKAVEIPAKEISQIIKNVKNEVCRAIENGEFKIWLAGEASGKILGIGASSEAGIEVVVKCEKKDKADSAKSTKS